MAYQVVREAEAEFGPFEVREIDISQEPDAVQRFGVTSTPAIAINGRVEFAGVPKTKKLIKRLKKIQSPSL